MLTLNFKSSKVRLQSPISCCKGASEIVDSSRACFSAKSVEGAGESTAACWGIPGRGGILPAGWIMPGCTMPEDGIMLEGVIAGRCIMTPGGLIMPAGGGGMFPAGGCIMPGGPIMLGGVITSGGGIMSGGAMVSGGCIMSAEPGSDVGVCTSPFSAIEHAC